jgi:DNA polymerase-3 subunit alpha
LSEITVGDYIRVSNYADPANVNRIKVGHKRPRPLWGRYRAYDDTVSCIRYIGKEETYDVEIAERSHCFYANGILSHNSHAVGYAILGYQAEYYKTHYPLAFMWASLVSEIGDKDRINILLNECKQKKIKILPPDINESKQTFALIDTYIRFGFNALASVSDKMGEEIVANAPYDSFYDFIGKVKCNINVANALIYAGCFDHFGTRKGHIEIAARELTASRKIKKSTMYHWLITPKAYDVSKEEFDKETLLIKEYEVLSFYITSHPITLFKKQIIESKMKRLNKKQEGQYLTCGLISSIKLHIDKNKNQMAFVTLEDIDGSSHEMVCFSSTYSLYKGLLSVGKVIGISCNVEKGKLIANWIGPMKF